MITDDANRWQPYDDPPPGLTPPSCDFFWGSHGCDLPFEHPDPLHRCESADEPCSWFDELAPPNRRWLHPREDDPTAPDYAAASEWYSTGFRFSYWSRWTADDPRWTTT